MDALPDEQRCGDDEEELQAPALLDDVPVGVQQLEELDDRQLRWPDGVRRVDDDRSHEARLERKGGAMRGQHLRA